MIKNASSMQNFTLSFRRVLYVATILKYNLEWLKRDELCPSHVKVDISNIENSLRRMMSNIRDRSGPQTWEIVKNDLGGDQLHDISLLLDAVANVENVGEITKVINEHKTVTPV